MRRNISLFRFVTAVSHHESPESLIATIPSGIASRHRLLQVLYEQLSFPEYFGFNWDALDECLRDFHWVTERIIAVIHEDLPELDERELVIYLEILADACLDWKSNDAHTMEVVFPVSLKPRIQSLLKA